MKSLNHNQNKSGFTALELLMVIAVITILAGLLLSGVTAANKRARVAQTKSFIESLNIAARTYRNDYYSFFPSTGFTHSAGALYAYLGSKFLAGKNSSINSGPYFEYRSNNLGTNAGTFDTDGDGTNDTVYRIIDIWGNALIYTNPGTHNINSIDIYSFGPDGEDDSGDDDDITNWK